MANTGPPASHFDFAQTLMAARTVPAPPDGTPGTPAEFPPTFGPAESEIEEAAPKPEVREGAVAIDLGVRQFSEVFMLWRPWEKCKRCRDKIDANEITLPEEGDYTCLHTRNRAYKEKVDHCLRGKGAITLREYFNLTNGNRMVHMEWCEKDPEAAEREKKKKELAAQNSLAPPHGTGDLGKTVPRI